MSKGEPNARPRSGAAPAAKPNELQSYLDNHRKVLRNTLRTQHDAPLASLFTCSVIGFALVLPTLLALLLSNLQQVNLGWDGSAQITLFMADHVSAEEGQAWSQQLNKRANITDVQFIDADEALAEFTAAMRLENTLSYLDENPLPHSIIITPHHSLKSLEDLQTLEQQLAQSDLITSSMLDVMWLQRLQAITAFLERGVWLIAGMLGLAVILILGNTIRLAIENRREEIIVLKLVGGTNAFVCRPFLYMGSFYGLGGSLIAVILSQIIISLLNGPVIALAQSYQSQYELSGLGFESTLFLLLVGTVLGWLGAWIAVRRHISAIEPD
ncbi:MAG: permease-like cell division protein FtsX [Oleiphilaceae bacterium]|nr:permease-like cell division protein FtsX [Oleiphilaceae bacterium]